VRISVKMEAEFDRADRLRAKERKSALQQRKQREEQEAKARKIAEDAEKKRLTVVQAQREKEAKRRQREEEEALSTGGIQYMAFMKPVPLANLETDRVRLPPSVLQKLSDEGAIDSRKILTFELALFDDVKDEIISKTHCGVLEFTAAEGTIEIPIKAAISLARERGDTALSSWKLRVRYVVVDRYEKIRASVQPLGSGFHESGQDSAKIDIKSVLQRVLSQQTTITEGDWIPLRHEGKTYTLAVRELSPDTQAVLINTDVEIDLMPSEDVVDEQKRQAAKEKEKVERDSRAKHLESSLPAEPVVGTLGTISIRARLPQSIVSSRRFLSSEKLETVFTWAGSLLGDVEPPSRNAKLEIVISLRPGEAIVYGEEKGASTLSQLSFARSENLNFRWKVVDEHSMDDVEEEKVQSRPSSSGSEEWSTSRAFAESALDRDLQAQASEAVAMSDEGESIKAEISSAKMFQLLVAKGADPVPAAQTCQKYLPCLRTLLGLGLLESPGSGRAAVELTNKFKGSAGRVADAMLGVEQEPESEKDKWPEQVAILESMFTGRDKQELMNALEKHGGSVQKAVNELLS